MLKRVHAGLFEEDAGSSIELAVVSQNNNGVESARFDYDSTVLAPAAVQGHPGCRFLVQAGIRQFRALVVFDPGAPATARYDLHQVNSAGTLQLVGKSVTKPAPTPLIGFSLDGVAVALVAGAPVAAPPPAAAALALPPPPPPPPPAPAGAAPARKAAGPRRPAKKAATRVPAKKAAKTTKRAMKKAANNTTKKRTSPAARTRKRATSRAGKSR